MLTSLERIDQAIFNSISRLPHPKIPRFIATAVHVTTWGGIIYYPFISYLAFQVTTLKISEMWFVSLLITYVITDIVLKNMFKRPRPYEGNPDVDPLPFPPRSYSFPSGQSAAAAASATILILMVAIPWCQILFAFSALLVFFDRMYTRHHYPSDVLGGAIIGTVVSLLIFHIGIRLL